MTQRNGEEVRRCEPLLVVSNLHVEFPSVSGPVRALRGVDMEVAPEETVAVVGESGSGKSTLGLALLRLVPPPGVITKGSIRFQGREILSLSNEEMRALRGRAIGMVFQDPMTALNPVFTCGWQVAEPLVIHRMSSVKAEGRATRMMDRVGIPDAARRAGEYPHRFSGGMRQRVAIGIAAVAEPALIILDEPTTALDVTVQERVLALIREIKAERRMAAILISHDLRLAAENADRIIVMYAGEIVEVGPASQVFRDPQHPYTQGLLRSLPRLDHAQDIFTPIPGDIPDLTALPEGCTFATRCPCAQPVCAARPPLEALTGPAGAGRRVAGRAVRCYFPGPVEETMPPRAVMRATLVKTLIEVRDLKVHFPLPPSLGDRLMRRPRESVHAVDGISFAIREGEVFGLVGESGCGKTTVGRVLLGLQAPTCGSVVFDGVDLGAQLRGAPREYRRRVQAIFQDPFASLNPRMTIGETLRRPAIIHGLARGRAADKRVAELLQMIGLQPAHARRFPHEFSQGQRQRIAVARAISVAPTFIVADEPVSSLDASIQAQILNLLMDLQRQLNLSMLFITHDLAVVRSLATRIGVMYLGWLAEVGTPEQLYERPLHPYTRALLTAVPDPQHSLPRSDRVILKGGVPSAVHVPSGCRLHTRCPFAMPQCSQIEPEPREVEPGRFIACHLV
jgi:oligopeptide/dipeptide ABC transporter ATP-binding protein